ncbi:MAG: acyl-CoA dehydrogenase [Cytophagales bacterium]|nr:acyl-CoA dehydrogenase [Cytophagales bacterium]
MSLRTTLDFLLYDWLNTDSLSRRSRFSDHSRETFDAVLDTCERIAREKYAPFNRLVDTQEPRTEMGDDGALRVILPQATHDARAAYADSGMLSAAQDYEQGGMQLPYTVEAAANTFFGCASISIGSNLLSVGNANCILTHGTKTQAEVFAANELNGRWAGTMCLSEPQAGSSLSDITTKAIADGANYANDPLGARYRLTGNKMWISSGEHDMTENIVHLVLAKIPDESGKLVAGTRGISLFIVPKRMVKLEETSTSSVRTGDAVRAGDAGRAGDAVRAGDAGRMGDAVRAVVGERNDVVLAGLNHKLGWRGTTNTLLNFGEGAFKPDTGSGASAGAVGYLVGKPGEGLRCMFHMMNEARIGIGMAATMLGLAGYYASLDYAKNRPQGRPISGAKKDASQPQVRLIEHADIKRMLLAQKSYGEGALALALYCARLVDEMHTAEADAANEARLLLEVLTPIVKSWPSEWCLEANSLAIQIHGGYGYTRDFPVEQYWRDNRLNMIHEGTHGIQAMDLLGRKVLMEDGAGLMLLKSRLQATVDKASQIPALQANADVLSKAFLKILDATKAAWSTGKPSEALANAVPYMQAFGHVVLAWMWLDVAITCIGKTDDASLGRLGAARFFFHYELPKIDAWLGVVSSRDATCADLPESAF